MLCNDPDVLPDFKSVDIAVREFAVDSGYLGINFRFPYKAGLYVWLVVMDSAKCWVSFSVKCEEMLDRLMNYWLFNNWLVGWLVTDFAVLCLKIECNGVNSFTWFSVRSSGRLF
jgi:hypothetical protein